MLAKIKAFFTNDDLASSDSAGKEQSLRLACAALMTEVAFIDSDFSEDEITVLKQALIKQFNLSEKECNELAAMAENERHESVSLHQFTRLVNEHADPEQKFALVVAMWSVALADGHLDKYEEHLIRRAADLIYLSHSDFIRAKHVAKHA